MLIPFLALLLIVSVVVGGGLVASSQVRTSTRSTAGEFRQPVEAGSFIVAMIFLAILGVVFVPLLILTIIFW
jgi:hypothetical protein